MKGTCPFEGADAFSHPGVSSVIHRGQKDNNSKAKIEMNRHKKSAFNS